MIRLLLLIPLFGLLSVPFSSRIQFFRLPVFYWYQLAWVPLTSVAVIVNIALGASRASDQPPQAARE